MQDPLLQLLVPAIAEVPGVDAIVLGGSRARGTATANSDYDVILYYSAATQLDTDRLREAIIKLVDKPGAAEVTPVGEWGPWIVGGAWLSIAGRKVDLLYRSSDAVAQVIHSCRVGHVTMDYQPGHPHGFCSAIWMGEIALCQPIFDPQGTIAELKQIALPYPEPLKDALIRRFQWEVLFSIENGEVGAARGEQTHVVGCSYRALACAAQVLFALNGRYLINEKAALQEAAKLPLTLPNLMEGAAAVWQFIGRGDFSAAFATLRVVDHELRALTNKLDDHL